MASPQTDPNLAGNQGPGIVVANLIVAVLAGVAVVLRFLARRVQGLSLQADDYLIFLALVSSTLPWGYSGIGADGYPAVCMGNVHLHCNR